MTNDSTPHENLRELQRLLIAELIAHLQKPGPSAEFLQVARRTCKDNGLLGLATELEDRQRLQELYGHYVKRLREAIAGEHPSAAVLAEVRVFLQSQGIGKDVRAVVDRGAALNLLADQRLPFNH